MPLSASVPFAVIYRDNMCIDANMKDIVWVGPRPRINTTDQRSKCSVRLDVDSVVWANESLHAPPYILYASHSRLPLHRTLLYSLGSYLFHIIILCGSLSLICSIALRISVHPTAHSTFAKFPDIMHVLPKIDRKISRREKTVLLLRDRHL